MVERRKMRERRVFPPKQGLPLYYRRYTADRRLVVQTARWNTRMGVATFAQPDA